MARAIPRPGKKVKAVAGGISETDKLKKLNKEIKEKSKEVNKIMKGLGFTGHDD